MSSYPKRVLTYQRVDDDMNEDDKNQGKNVNFLSFLTSTYSDIHHIINNIPRFKISDRHGRFILELLLHGHLESYLFINQLFSLRIFPLLCTLRISLRLKMFQHIHHHHRAHLHSVPHNPALPLHLCLLLLLFSSSSPHSSSSHRSSSSLTITAPITWLIVAFCFMTHKQMEVHLHLSPHSHLIITSRKLTRMKHQTIKKKHNHQTIKRSTFIKQLKRSSVMK